MAERYDALASAWWTAWLDLHGGDSPRHRAFLGYLTTHGIDHRSEPHVLQAAYDAYVLWVEESEATIPGKGDV